MWGEAEDHLFSTIFNEPYAACGCGISNITRFLSRITNSHIAWDRHRPSGSTSHLWGQRQPSLIASAPDFALVGGNSPLHPPSPASHLICKYNPTMSPAAAPLPNSSHPPVGGPGTSLPGYHPHPSHTSQRAQPLPMPLTWRSVPPDREMPAAAATPPPPHPGYPVIPYSFFLLPFSWELGNRQLNQRTPHQHLQMRDRTSQRLGGL